MKICLAASAGGHLTQMLRLMDAFEDHDVFFVTIKAKSSENLSNACYLRDTAGPTKIHMIFNMVIVAIQSLRIILRERPRVIVSTGADVTIPICYIGKFFGVKIIFIESLSRLTSKSGAGKIIYPITDLFLVQWESLLGKYGKKAKYWGKVI